MEVADHVFSLCIGADVPRQQRLHILRNCHIIGRQRTIRVLPGYNLLYRVRHGRAVQVVLGQVEEVVARRFIRLCLLQRDFLDGGGGFALVELIYAGSLFRLANL